MSYIFLRASPRLQPGGCVLRASICTMRTTSSRRALTIGLGTMAEPVVCPLLKFADSQAQRVPIQSLLRILSGCKRALNLDTRSLIWPMMAAALCANYSPRSRTHRFPSRAKAWYLCSKRPSRCLRSRVYEELLCHVPTVGSKWTNRGRTFPVTRTPRGSCEERGLRRRLDPRTDKCATIRHGDEHGFVHIRCRAPLQNKLPILRYRSRRCSEPFVSDSSARGDERMRRDVQ
jgi:hypothetical protein